MANITITNIDMGHVVIDDGEYEDGLLTSAGATTYLEGTILARDTVSLKFVPFVIGGSTNGNGIPSALLTYEHTVTAAGDTAVRVLKTGVVDQGRIVVQADGDASNVTAAHRDALRDYGIICQPVNQLAQLDNQ